MQKIPQESGRRVQKGSLRTHARSVVSKAEEIKERPRWRGRRIIKKSKSPMGIPTEAKAASVTGGEEGQMSVASPEPHETHSLPASAMVLPLLSHANSSGQQIPPDVGLTRPVPDWRSASETPGVRRTGQVPGGDISQTTDGRPATESPPGIHTQCTERRKSARDRCCGSRSDN